LPEEPLVGDLGFSLKFQIGGLLWVFCANNWVPVLFISPPQLKYHAKRQVVFLS
jgi:hypothetical protein